MKAIDLALTFAGSLAVVYGCSTNVAPVIVVATPRDCAVACAHLDACACEETCDRISQSGFLATDLACIAAASSCDAVRACGVAQTAKSP